MHEQRTCRTCGNPFTPHDRPGRAPQAYCRAACAGKRLGGMPKGGGGQRLAVPWQERFWRYITPGAADECWEWQGARNEHGYGRLNSGGRGKDGYPPEWHETIKHAVREDAGHRCVRCLHPYVKGAGEWSPCDAECRHGGPVRFVGRSTTSRWATSPSRRPLPTGRPSTLAGASSPSTTSTATRATAAGGTSSRSASAATFRSRARSRWSASTRGRTASGSGPTWRATTPGPISARRSAGTRPQEAVNEAAAHLRDLVEKRDETMRAALAAGHSIRSITDITGLGVGTVHNRKKGLQ
jgi:hypothetical protein